MYEESKTQCVKGIPEFIHFLIGGRNSPVNALGSHTEVAYEWENVAAYKGGVVGLAGCPKMAMLVKSNTF